MRVNIHIPDHQILHDGPSSSKIDLSHLPVPLVRLAPSNELVMIELQGSLEIEDPDPKGGQVLGRIEFHPGREDRPTLLISHHRLEGRLVSLIKPLAVLEKKQRILGSEDDEDTENGGVMKAIDINKASDSTRIEREKRVDDLPSSPLRFAIGANGHSAQNDDTDDPSNSPTISRKRLRQTDSDHLTIDSFTKTSSLQPPPSSSPIPMKKMQGSELDFSSPLPASKRKAIDQIEESCSKNNQIEAGDGIDEDEWLYKKGQTSTYMEVVCIIRKKFLFSKRPEPVVRLDSEGGHEEK